MVNGCRDYGRGWEGGGGGGMRSDTGGRMRRQSTEDLWKYLQYNTHSSENTLYDAIMIDTCP